MNYTRTAILLAGLTALFMAVGYLLGGAEGMVIAFIVAVAMNLFSYWRSDKLVLSMHGAQEVDDRTAPEFVGLVRELSTRAGLPMPRVYPMDNPQPDRAQSGARSGRRHHRPARHTRPRQCGPPDREPARATKPGDGAALYRQPAGGAPYGQSVLDPSLDREPHRRPRRSRPGTSSLTGATTSNRKQFGSMSEPV
jgi:hypothetical protein